MELFRDAVDSGNEGYVVTILGSEKIVFAEGKILEGVVENGININTEPFCLVLLDASPGVLLRKTDLFLVGLVAVLDRAFGLVEFDGVLGLQLAEVVLLIKQVEVIDFLVERNVEAFVVDHEVLSEELLLVHFPLNQFLVVDPQFQFIGHLRKKQLNSMVFLVHLQFPAMSDFRTLDELSYRLFVVEERFHV